MPLLLSVRSRRGNLQGRVGPDDLATHFDAALHASEKLRVAVAAFAARACLEAVSRGRRGLLLDRLRALVATAFPGVPVLPLQTVNAGQFTELGVMEVIQSLPLPLGLDGL
jgi:hypothetical protein